MNNMLNKLLNRWYFDYNELSLIRKRKSREWEQKGKKVFSIMIQAPFDYYYLSLYALVIKKHKSIGNYNYVAVFPEIFRIIPDVGYKNLFSFIVSLVDRYLTKLKWKKLYRSIGVDQFHEINNVSFFEKLKSLQNGYTEWRKLNSKKELLDLTLNGVKCGDLIYDTYLRYRVRPTLNIKDIYLLFLLYQCFNVLKGTNVILDRLLIKSYFTSYTSYIHHGIIVRNCKLKNINIYTSGNLQQRFKYLKKFDLYHTSYFCNYYTEFNDFPDTSEKLAISRRMLLDKFTGTVDHSISYMKESSFLPSENNNHFGDIKFDGVIFLHDFFDSPHIYGAMLFVDFYEWVVHTLKLIAHNNLNIAVKPHPNQVKSSQLIISDLKLLFPTIEWLDTSLSNSVIFNSGIKYGISVYGTVLHELAYHGIHAISAGENPHSSYQFIQKPKTIRDYDLMILCNDKLVMPDDYKGQIESFYYMHNINSRSELDIDVECLKDFNMLNSTSETIKQILTVL